jgi:muconolactone delta-isomerase
MARYLVTGEYVDPGPLMPPEAVAQMVETAVIPGHEYMAELEASGKLLAGGIIAGERAGAFILEADSHAEVNELLGDCPYWGLIKWNVKPLQSPSERAAADRRRLEEMKKRLDS